MYNILAHTQPVFLNIVVLVGEINRRTQAPVGMYDGLAHYPCSVLQQDPEQRPQMTIVMRSLSGFKQKMEAAALNGKSKEECAIS